MMKIARLGIALLFTGIACWATPSNCPTTGPGTDLNTLNGNGGCFQIDVLFSSFAVTSTGTIAGPGLADISMFGAGPGPLTDAIFDTPGANQWTAPGGNPALQLVSNLSYEATLQSTNDFVSIGIGGGSVTGNGLVIITESYCVGALTTVGCPGGSGGSVTAVFFNGVLQSNSSPAVFLPTSQMVAITDQIQMLNTDPNPTTLTSLDNQFQEFTTPEPGTLLLIGSALGAFGFLRRRANRG